MKQFFIMILNLTTLTCSGQLSLLQFCTWLNRSLISFHLLLNDNICIFENSNRSVYMSLAPGTESGRKPQFHNALMCSKYNCASFKRLYIWFASDCMLWMNERRSVVGLCAVLALVYVWCVIGWLVMFSLFRRFIVSLFPLLLYTWRVFIHI